MFSMKEWSPFQPGLPEWQKKYGWLFELAENQTCAANQTLIKCRLCANTQTLTEGRVQPLIKHMEVKQHKELLKVVFQSLSPAFAGVGKTGGTQLTLSNLQVKNASPALRDELADWLIESRRPVNVVEDRKFRALMETHFNTKLPTRKTATRDIDRACASELSTLIEEVKQSFVIGLSFDPW